MIQTIKDTMIKWLFARERARLGALEGALEAKIATASLDDVLFKKLRKFDPRLLDGVDIVLTPDGQVDITSDIFDDVQRAGHTREAFLAESQTLYKNWALPIIKDYFTRNQILMSFKSAKTLDEINFGRAVVIASKLERDEIDRLHMIFEEAHKPPEDNFDRHELGDGT